MRNLKKLFAVIMTVAMLASVMVPALAAEGFQYEADAQKLYDLGLFKGNSDTSYVPDLGTTLNRQAGLALAIRMSGKEDAVKAMTEEEIATQLAKIVDADEITEWAKPYAAYAVKNGLTNGIDANILPNVKFGAQLDLTGKEFINFVLKAMGYQVAWDDVLTKAAEVGMLSAGDAVTFGTTPVMNRDAAVGVMASALGGTTASGVTLAQKLVDDGAVDGEAMAAAGFFTPTVAPTAAPVELTFTASTTNNIQINVVYSEAVEKDSAQKVDNYKLSKGAIDKAELQDDGVTVVLTLKEADAKAQEDKVDLTIKNVKSAAGVAIAETTVKDILFLDKDIPTVVDAQVVGKDTIKVIFSEPMDNDSSITVGDVTTYYLDKAGFVVNGGKLYVKEAKLQKNYTEALVKLYSTLPEGEVTIQVKSTSEDFAGFGVIGKLITLNVVKDAEAPVVVGYENAKPTEVTLIWNEDIELDGAVATSEWYHTNGNNAVESVKVDGNKTTLTFTDAKKLPQGTAYVYVLKEAVKDYWGNKNAQQMIQVEVVIDVTAPEVTEVKQGSDELTVIVTFNEKMKNDSDSTLKKANYTILDKDGAEQKDLVTGIAFDDGTTQKKVKLTLSKKLGGDYSLVIKGVKDEAGNEVVEATIPFTVVDKTKPVVADFKAVVYNIAAKGQMVKVSFGEAMNVEGKYAVNDIDNYIIGTKALKDIKNVKIAVVDSGKAVEITIPSVADSNVTDGYNIVLPLNLTIARVADAAGNYTDELQIIKAISNSAASPVTFTAEATARDTIKLTFDDEVKFEVGDFTITDGVTVTDNVYKLGLAAIETSLNDKGKTVATFTLANKLSELFDNGDASVTIAATPKTENKYGVKVDGASVGVDDKISPDLYDDGIADNGKDYITVTNAVYLEATIKFSEAIADVNEVLAGNDLVVKLDGKELVNGTDFNVLAASLDDQDNVITLRFKGTENSAKTKMVLKGSLTIDRVASPNHIKDLNGNKLAAFKTIQLDVNVEVDK